MNTEQLRKEFEAWYFNRRKEWREQGIELSDADANSMWDGYQAAAQSRDELIGKVVKYLNAEKGMSTPKNVMINVLLKDLKAQGYGE